MVVMDTHTNFSRSSSDFFPLKPHNRNVNGHSMSSFMFILLHFFSLEVKNGQTENMSCKNG